MQQFFSKLQFRVGDSAIGIVLRDQSLLDVVRPLVMPKKRLEGMIP